MRTTIRGITVLAAAATALALFAMPARAGDTKVLALQFPYGDAGAARIGPSADLSGSVRSEQPSVVDFYGRGVVTVPDMSAFDPGAGTFSMGVRISLTRGAGSWNIVQKGYWSDAGQWKLSLDDRASGLRFSCRFKGDQGEVMAYSSPGVVQVGGPSVKVVCARVGDQVTIEVDGQVVGRASGPIGTVANSRPVLIGSKGMDAEDPDQFLGEIDGIWIRS